MAGPGEVINMAEIGEIHNISVYLNDSFLTEDMRFTRANLIGIIGYSILMVLSGIGNTTVLILLIKKRLKAPSRIDAMLMHLAIADLTVTFILMPLEIGWTYTVDWRGGDTLCRVMSFFRTFGVYLSSFVIICISLDRYYAIMKPLKISGIDSRSRAMLLCAWIGAFICSLPQGFIFHVENHPNVTWYKQCVDFNSFGDSQLLEKVYKMSTIMIFYATPLIVILICYSRIYYKIYQRTKKALTVRRSNVDVLGRAKRRTLRMTITIVIVFIICWTPFSIQYFWYYYDKKNAEKVPLWVQKFLFLFACTNSSMNPIVYGIYNVRKKKDRTIVNQISSNSKRSEHSTSKSI